jgi:hypothetical protein
MLIELWERFEESGIRYEMLLLPTWEMTEAVWNCLAEPNGFWQWERDGSLEDLAADVELFGQKLGRVWRMLRAEIVSKVPTFQRINGNV